MFGRILTLSLLLCAFAFGQTSQPSATITFTDSIDLGGKVINAQKLPKPKWIQPPPVNGVPQPARWDGAWNLLETAATGDIFIRNGTLTAYQAGGATIKFNSLSNSVTVEKVTFIGNGAYTFASPHPMGAGPWAPGIVAYTRRLNIKDCAFIACGTGSKFGELLYPRADTTIVEDCDFIGCGTIMQSPNLITPESIPRLIFKNCTFEGADFWNDNRGGWMGSVWFVNAKSVISTENCTFSGKWRHILSGADPTRYIGRKNTFENLTFEDSAIAFGGRYTLAQWLALGTEIDPVVK